MRINFYSSYLISTSQSCFVWEYGLRSIHKESFCKDNDIELVNLDGLSPVNRWVNE